MSDPEVAGPPCMVCEAEPAYFSLMVMATYEQIKVGLECAPGFLHNMGSDVSGQIHNEDVAGCPACEAIHGQWHEAHGAADEAAPDADDVPAGEDGYAGQLLAEAGEQGEVPGADPA